MSTVSVRSIIEKIQAEGIRAVLDNITDADAIRITEEYGTHNYDPLPVNVRRGDGIYVYDGDGNEFIDCIGSYSAVAHGHLAPEVIAALTEQLENITLTSRAVYTTEMALFLEVLCEFTNTEMACPMNTGAEAVETAIKLARKWAYTIKRVPQNQAEIIAATDNFHGRTTTIVGFSTEAQYKENFGPFTPGFKVVEFGDINALKNAITPNTAAVLMEPIQAEGGIIIPPAGYLAQVRKLCTENNVLLIWDEIQTGFARTGKDFAWQHEDAEPDMMCLGKALGGGVYPVSAVVGKKSVLGVFKPGDHGSTFGGNPLAAVVGIAAMSTMREQNLTERSERLGRRLMDGLEAIRTEAVEDIRGRGLLVGLEVKEGVDTHALSQAFLDQRILTKETRSRTFRFAPPLTITEEQVDEIIRRVAKALEAVS
ncbi:MAG: ornithine--oxo-acid transaminase [Armatimonadota bacterium]|nr:ornithine--oxo-acid transaminase [Armatimonadota bacterium]